MSMEQAREFLARVDDDEQVRASVRSAYANALLGIATDLGYDVSSEDLSAVASEMTDLGDELSLSQLEEVAGGGRTRGGGFGIATDSVR